MDEDRLLIYNANLLTPSGSLNPGWLLTAGKTIHALGAGTPPEIDDLQDPRQIDAQGAAVMPGFIDLHVHGGYGHDTMDASLDGLRGMAHFYAQHGVTSFLATTWTASREETLIALEAIAGVTGSIPGGATLLGAHLEGPYLNPAKCGAQDVRLIRRASQQEAMEFLDTGCVRLVALAPEYPENLWLIDACVRGGITVAAGHTMAGYEEMHVAVQHGLSQVTHCFNGMRGFGHRDLGTVGAAMALPELDCELIADNIHVHPAAQKILLDVKGDERVILVTDAVRAAGLPDGAYALGERAVTLSSGAVRLPDGSLAGSVLTMEKALENLCRAAGRTVETAWQLSSLNAARAIGVASNKGSLEAGKDADLVLLEADYTVRMTLVEGMPVFERKGGNRVRSECGAPGIGNSRKRLR